MSGGASIRAFGSEEYSMQVNDDCSDLMNVTNTVMHHLVAWTSMQARKVSIVLVALACFNIWISSYFGYTNYVMQGILLKRMFDIGFRLIWIVHQYAHLEKTLPTVDKVFKLFDIDQENKNQPEHPDKSWPQNGGIVADKVKLRYRPECDLVLKGLSVNIKGGEKVGIVGRTGAGKSTLASGLTRLVEICGGSLKFDGVNISDISLD